MISTGYATGRRHHLLSSLLEPTTRDVLERVGIPRDARCIDVGCGGGDVTSLLATMAPAGTVIGTDPDALTIELAGLGTAGLGNIELHVEDIASTVERERASFDIVYVRFLLSHLAGAGTWIDLLARLVRPGGALVVEDVRIDGAFCSPPSAAFDRWVAIDSATLRRHGGDPQVGPHLPRMLQAAGLGQIGIQVVQPAALTGDAKLIQLLTLRATAEAAIAAGVTTPTELAALEGELEALVERSDTVVSTAQIVQTWGRPPAA